MIEAGEKGGGGGTMVVTGGGGAVVVFMATPFETGISVNPAGALPVAQ